MVWFGSTGFLFLLFFLLVVVFFLVVQLMPWKRLTNMVLVKGDGWLLKGWQVVTPGGGVVMIPFLERTCYQYLML